MPYALNAAHAAGQTITAADENAQSAAINALSARPYDLSLPPYSADLSGVTDMTTTLQAAINDAAANSSGGVVYLPTGTLKITSTITWPVGVVLRGGFAKAGKTGPPYLAWAGSQSANMFQLSTAGASHFNLIMENLGLGGTANGNGPLNILYCGERVDSGMSIRGCGFQYAEGYAIVFNGGGINVHLADFRADHNLLGTVKWVVGGSDNLSLSRFTVDNVRSDHAQSAGTLYVDATNAAGTQFFSFGVHDAKLETNLDLPTGTAHLDIHLAPTIGSKAEVHAHLDSVWEAPGSGVTSHTGLQFTPASDFQTVILDNCVLSVAGVPRYQRSLVGGSNRRVFSVFAPALGPQVGINPGSGGAEATTAELVGEWNLIGNLDHYGFKAAPLTYGPTSDAGFAGVTLSPGDLVNGVASTGLGGGAHQVVSQVKTAGTLGTLAGVTGSGTIGTSTLTVNTTAGLATGQFLSVAGANASVRVDQLDTVGLTVTLHNTLTATVSGAAVGYAAPAFNTGQFVPLVGSLSFTPGAIAANGSATSGSITVTGAAVGDLVEASFSAALPTGCVACGQVTAANTATVTIVNATASPTSSIAAGTARVRIVSQ